MAHEVMLLFAWAAAAAAADQGTGNAPPQRGIARLEVHVAEGDVRVRGHRGGRVRWHAQPAGGAPTCRARWRREGTTLHLDTVDADTAASACALSLDVEVDPSTAVALQLGRGRATVSGLRAELAVTIEAGGAVVGGELPALTVDLAAGSLSATGLFGQVRLGLAQGNAQLWYTEPPRRSQVTLDVGRGHVTVGAPQTSMVSRVQLDAGQILGGDGAGEGRLELDGHIGRGNLDLRAGRR